MLLQRHQMRTFTPHAYTNSSSSSPAKTSTCSSGTSTISSRSTSSSPPSTILTSRVGNCPPFAFNASIFAPVIPLTYSSRCSYPVITASPSTSPSTCTGRCVSPYISPVTRDNSSGLVNRTSNAGLSSNTDSKTERRPRMYRPRRARDRATVRRRMSRR